MAESRFKTEAAQAAAAIQKTEKELKGEKSSERKVPMNLTLPLEHKKRLIAYAKRKGFSASVIVQMWIDEHC